jgi:hypothetical protein
MRACKKCQIELTTENWYKSQGLQCRRCWNLYQKEHRKPRPKEKVSEENARPINRFRRLRASTKTRGHEVLINFNQFEEISNQPCIYCQNKLCESSSQGSNLDRIDNSKGYTIENVRPCCKICNSIRNIFLSVQETHIVVQALLKFRGI